MFCNFAGEGDHPEIDNFRARLSKVVIVERSIEAKHAASKRDSQRAPRNNPAGRDWELRQSEVERRIRTDPQAGWGKAGIDTLASGLGFAPMLQRSSFLVWQSKSLDPILALRGFALTSALASLGGVELGIDIVGLSWSLVPALFPRHSNR